MNRKWNSVVQMLAILTFVVVLLGVSAPTVRAATPCCEIVSINSSTGVVTAKVNATGQEFEFTLSNRAQLRTLKIGQPFYANLTTKQVSLDGQHPAGQVVSINPATAKASPLGVVGTALDPKLAFKPYGSMSSVQGLSVVATNQLGTAAQPPTVQFEIPASQQGQARPGQPVWLSPNGQQVRFVAFPIYVPDTKTRVGRGAGKGSFWVETKDALVSTDGVISGVTKVQSEDFIDGFTGNVALRLLDSQGNDLAGWLKAGCWGVNLRSGRTETWTIKVDTAVAVQARTVDLRQFDSPCGHDRWAAALAEAKDVAEVAGQFVQVYTSATGGTSTTPSTTPNSTTPSTPN